MLRRIFAAFGLVTDSSVLLISSMLVSPLMVTRSRACYGCSNVQLFIFFVNKGPILAITFGHHIRDKVLQNQGTKVALVGLALCLSFGFVFGIGYGITGNWCGHFLLTNEMVARYHIQYAMMQVNLTLVVIFDRGKLINLIVGSVIGLASGIVVALAVLGGYGANLIGTAISISLLPPTVNAVSVAFIVILPCLVLIFYLNKR